MAKTTTSRYMTPTGPGVTMECDCGTRPERFTGRNATQKADDRVESHTSYHQAMDKCD